MSKTYMCSANSISNQKFLFIMTSYVSSLPYKRVIETNNYIKLLPSKQ